MLWYYSKKFRFSILCENADVLEQKGENQVMHLEDMEGELTEEVKQENLEECQNCEALKEMKEKLCQEKERCFSL